MLRPCGQGALNALPADSVVGVAEFAYEGTAPHCCLSRDAPLTQHGHAALQGLVAAHLPKKKKGWGLW